MSRWAMSKFASSDDRARAMFDALEKAEAEVERLKGALSETHAKLVACVPTTWLDPLLTGPDAVLGEPPWDCPEVEALLGAIKKRMEDEK